MPLRTAKTVKLENPHARFLFLILRVLNVEAQSSFFEGKTIRIIVGLPAGDVYDL